MKMLIYGYKGWIGKQIIKELDKEKIKYVCGKTRVDDTKKLINEINEVKPTHILSLIGRTHGKIDDIEYTTIDYLEQKDKLVENIRDNLYAPITLALLCKEKGIHLTYLGTGCIFEYNEGHLIGGEGFREEDEPNFFGSSYSIVKGFTDRLMHLFENTVLNLRIRMPINTEKNKRNFITKITSYKKICSISNSMTVLPELIPIAIDMILKKTTGTINLTNPGIISHNEILEMYKEIVDERFEWTNFTIEEQEKILASKRSNNYLDTSKLCSLYPEIKEIKESIREILKLYPKDNELDFVNDGKTSILVTGGYGFIGSNFINKLFVEYDKIKIINMDAMYYCANEKNIKENIRESKNYKSIKGTICDEKKILKILEEHNITHVINFAAQSHVDKSFEDPLQFMNDNIIGTHVLIECCRKYGKIKKFIQISTDEVYGGFENQKTENSQILATNPYAATKGAADIILQSYIHSYGMPIIITRSNNIYGPNQYPEKIIPLFIKLLKENKKVTIHGNGNMKRSYIYIDDIIDAILIILCKGKVGEIYNIGGDENIEYTALEVAKILIKIIKKTDEYDEWIEYIEDRPYNDERYLINSEKIKKLGWEIKINFIDGLNKIIDSIK